MKRTIAKFAKIFGTPVSVATALTLLPAGAHADLIFEHEGHTYKLIESTATWEQANTTAEKMTLGGLSGYLARIDSAAENAAIFEVLSARLSSKQREDTTPDDGSGSAFIWLGGSDAASEGDWRWVNNGDRFWAGDFNGSSVGGRYHNWGVQPDDANGNENALAMGLGGWPEPFYDLGAAGQWNDLDPNNSLMYVIEFDTTVEPMQMALNEPLNRSTQAGVGMVRGWVVSEEPVDRIEVYLDGRYVFDIPYGDPRPDIAAKFPESEGAATSGFSVAYRFSALPAGDHTIDVVITDSFGNRIERSSSFEVVRFEKGYISPSEAPNMDWSYPSSYGDLITVRGVTVAGETYNIWLRWQSGTQKFEMVRIEAISNN